MFKLTFLRTLGLVGLVMLVIAGVVSGQDQLPARGTLEQLLGEVRGLRSEFSHATGASIRAQLLVARLQLQEQRITNLGRQLSDLQSELTALDESQSAAATKLRQFEEGRGRWTAEQQDQADREAEALTAAIEQSQKRARELRAQEREIENLLVEEQARWSDFNGRLDDLELSLPNR